MKLFRCRPPSVNCEKQKKSFSRYAVRGDDVSSYSIFHAIVWNIMTQNVCKSYRAELDLDLDLVLILVSILILIMIWSWSWSRPAELVLEVFLPTKKKSLIFYSMKTVLFSEVKNICYYWKMKRFYHSVSCQLILLHCDHISYKYIM